MRSLVLVCTVCVSACGPAVVGEDATGDETQTGTEATSVGPTTTSSTSSTTSVSDTDSTTTVGPGTDTGCGDDGVCLDLAPPVCPEHPDFACSGPIDCEAQTCGGTFSPFDDQGCLRPTCGDDADCSGDEVCFRPQDWGGCASSGLFCEDDPSGQCVCGGDPDCGGSYCLPADLAPPADCGSLDDEQICLDAGCSGWVGGRPIIPSGNACLCDLEQGYCLWSASGLAGNPESTPYVRMTDFAVVVFPTRFDDDPIGWTPCDALPNPPGECECAEFICNG